MFLLDRGEGDNKMGSIRQTLLNEVLHWCPICEESLLGIEEELIVPSHPYSHRECLPVTEWEKRQGIVGGDSRQGELFPNHEWTDLRGGRVVTDIEAVRRKIEELRLKQALNPDFGRKISVVSSKPKMSKEEKEEFKKWQREQSKE